MRRGSSGIAVAAAVTFFCLLGVAGAADLLVSSRNSNQVLAFNGTTGAPAVNPIFVAAGSGGLSSPAGLAFSPAAQLHVAAAAGDAVLQYDGVTGASIGSFATSGLDEPAGTTFGRDGHLYVASRGDHRVVRYDGTTGAVVGDFVTAGSDIFVDPANGDFPLAANSPAIGAGQATLFHAGLERVPTFDFEGDPRPEDLPSIGFDERP